VDIYTQLIHVFTKNSVCKIRFAIIDVWDKLSLDSTNFQSCTILKNSLTNIVLTIFVKFCVIRVFILHVLILYLNCHAFVSQISRLG